MNSNIEKILIKPSAQPADSLINPYCVREIESDPNYNMLFRLNLSIKVEINEAVKKAQRNLNNGICKEKS